MGVIYRNLIRPFLFRLDPEDAHERGIASLQLLGGLSPVCRVLEHFNLRPTNTQPVELFGLKFPNCVGLAAGMDKDGRCWQAAAALGFGHVEVGTVTGQKQPGNDRPRVFRYPKEEALINRMGFNNEGAEAMAARLKKALRGHQRPIPLGINLGKSKIVPIEKASEDYLFSFNQLAPYADYVTINISSPNTPNLRQLQNKEHLPELLRVLNDANHGRARKLGVRPIPLLLKIAPDISFAEIDRLLGTCLEFGISGIIATNTTISRPGMLAIDLHETGGLSGRPLHHRSVEMVHYIARATGGNFPIIGCGGIMDGVDAGRMMDAGASLVQLYTGFIYGGPFFAKEVAHALSAHHSKVM
ncbi:MAG: quinone-dependent dihydroorotate dehydrogenase [Verrucomicrobiota bacterium]|nr:quinone-dependent dihydroorotate dehydrogenase [Verrucomicrobiota bacterium]